MVNKKEFDEKFGSLFIQIKQNPQTILDSMDYNTTLEFIFNLFRAEYLDLCELLVLAAVDRYGDKVFVDLDKRSAEITLIELNDYYNKLEENDRNIAGNK